MPKHDAFAPKAIANRQKLVGLQKLRWYCQMCEKQCRDENGFKCHTMSEGHLRQMRLFSQNSGSILDQFSQEFEQGFLRILSHMHGTKRVQANRVYQEYIADKNHIHMNATVWTTLTGFCKHLGKEGKAIVDETEKGWYIQYVDRDPVLLAKQQEFEARQKEELEEEERINKLLKYQIKQAKLELADGGENCASSESEQQTEEVGPVRITIGSNGKMPDDNKSTKRPIKSVFGGDDEEDDEVDEKASNAHKMKKMKSYEPLMNSEVAGWLKEGIILKVVNKKIHRGEYYGLKGEVIKVLDAHTCKLRLGDKEITVLDEDVQTVVPHVGEKAMIVKGKHMGRIAVVKNINRDHYNCDLQIVESDGTLSILLTRMEYDDFSKLAEQ